MERIHFCTTTELLSQLLVRNFTTMNTTVSSSGIEFDVNAITPEYLERIAPSEVIKLTIALRDENKKLLETATDEVAKRYEDRFIRLERELNLQKQYERRSSIEITGIPQSVEDGDIEDAVIKVLKSAKAKAHSKFPSHLDIHAAHRKGKKGVVICKFVNRKYAYSALYNSPNLKNSDVFENGEAIYINPSLCPEFAFLHFAVRKAKKDKVIHSYKVRHGVMFMKKTETDREIEISHENDLALHGLPIPERKY